MSAHILLNLLNELKKRDKMQRDMKDLLLIKDDKHRVSDRKGSKHYILKVPLTL